MAKNSIELLPFKNICAYDCDWVLLLSRPFGGEGGGGVNSIRADFEPE